jgi:hypothetical protein
MGHRFSAITDFTSAPRAFDLYEMRHAPRERIVRREVAQDVVNAARDFEGALVVRVEDKRQGPSKLHDLPSLHDSPRALPKNDGRGARE